MELWSEGIYLLGLYNKLQTGCWLLCHGKEGAILELPPYGRKQKSPVKAARDAAKDLKLEIKYIMASHDHWDHYSRHTCRQFVRKFSRAQLCMHKSFAPESGRSFEQTVKLELSGEPLFMVYAPKHSMTDTLVIFRGAIFTGDWELNTIRSVHDGKVDAVPMDRRLESIEYMAQFEEKNNYRIHKVFSNHANDRRENVDFKELMEDTKQDRKLW